MGRMDRQGEPFLDEKIFGDVLDYAQNSALISNELRATIRMEDCRCTRQGFVLFDSSGKVVARLPLSAVHRGNGSQSRRIPSLLWQRAIGVVGAVYFIAVLLNGFQFFSDDDRSFNWLPHLVFTVPWSKFVWACLWSAWALLGFRLSLALARGHRFTWLLGDSFPCVFLGLDIAYEWVALIYAIFGLGMAYSPIRLSPFLLYFNLFILSPLVPMAVALAYVGRSLTALWEASA